MDDRTFLREIARLWIDLGGDAEGVAWTWRDLQVEIEKQQRESHYEELEPSDKERRGK